MQTSTLYFYQAYLSLHDSYNFLKISIRINFQHACLNGYSLPLNAHPKLLCWLRQVFMAHYNFLLSCVCLLQLKQENKLIFDEKCALLGCHYPSTNWA